MGLEAKIAFWVFEKYFVWVEQTVSLTQLHINPLWNSWHHMGPTEASWTRKCSVWNPARRRGKLRANCPYDFYWYIRLLAVLKVLSYRNHGCIFIILWIDYHLNLTTPTVVSTVPVTLHQNLFFGFWKRFKKIASAGASHQKSRIQSPFEPKSNLFRFYFLFPPQAPLGAIFHSQ